MPLESATYISQLVPANPAATDPIQQGANHLQLTKQILQNQFPNLGTVAVTATATAINTSAGMALNSGTIEVPNNGTIAGAEVLLDGVASSGTLAAAGKVAFLNAGTVAGPGLLEILLTGTAGTLQTAFTLDALGDLTLPGTLNAASIQQAGNPLLPSGVILLWSGASSAIPAGFHLCDGTSGTPDLRNKFIIGAGSTYAVAQTGGAASVTAATDTQGAHNHTGSTGSAGAFTPTGTTDSQGAHSHTGVTGGHALTVAELAAHTHTFSTQDRGSSTTNGIPNSDAGAAGVQGQTDSAGNGNAHTHPISTDGLHSHNLSINAAPAHVHSVSTDGSHLHNVTVATLPPFYALCYIMKL